MKNIKKKLLVLVLAASAFTMCSCDTQNKTNENPDAEVTLNEPDNTDVVSESPEVTSSVSEREVTEEFDPSVVPDLDTQDFLQYIEEDEIVFKEVDFDSFPSGKYVKAFRNGPYNIVIYPEGSTDTRQDIYFADGKFQVKMDTDGVQYDIIYMDGKMHNVYNDSYYAEAHPVDQRKYNIFGFLDYIESGTDMFNGTECRYDEFNDLLGNVKCRIYLNDDGDMIAFEESDQVIIIDSFREDFSKEGLFTIPENVKSLSYAEFSQVMMKAFTDAAAEKSGETVKSESSESITDVSSAKTGSEA